MQRDRAIGISRRHFIAAPIAAPLVGAMADVPAGDGVPPGNYTPFGYLDNPFHSWNLHRSGILRSVAGIGLALYYPAGPGGYFDYRRNGVYEAHLRLGFRIGEKLFWAPEDFGAGQLTSPYHTKNLLAYAFHAAGVRVGVTVLQVDEDALGARIMLERARESGPVELIAAQQCRLGGASWWGRDGLASGYDRARDVFWIRSFAAGPVLALACSEPSRLRSGARSEQELRTWFGSASNGPAEVFRYHPDPLYGALRCDGAKSEIGVVLARAANVETAVGHARTALSSIAGQVSRKTSEDARFWRGAPRLEGDWPDHWKHGWVYDFETLRMMVRRPGGLYRHSWDPMQVQAPRNVLAETSIDMWALSYADPDSAKEVFLGQFLDAIADNIPCMREDGEMNMVAADGSACGTSISWCYPFYCAHSIWARTQDRKWLAALYPRLGRLLRWTLAHRSDSGGFIVGKCSWETGMDGSRRFLIKQPTGAELTEFVRVVELQAATSQAAGILLRFAGILGETADAPEWQRIERIYAQKTRDLWHRDWFYDFDTRSNQPITSVGRDVGQVAPIFCGIATPDQTRAMLAAMQAFYDDSVHNRRPGSQDWEDELHWSSLVFPYLESLWSAGESELLARTVHFIADRIYRSMDRRSVDARTQGLQPAGEAAGSGPHLLGWPGVSCEVWGADGAYGGEGYGWGAVMPAHIIRNLMGVRETETLDSLWIGPNLPDDFAAAGKRYAVRNVRYGPGTLELAYRFSGRGRVQVEGAWTATLDPAGLEDVHGNPVRFERAGRTWRFEAANHSRYRMRLARRAGN